MVNIEFTFYFFIALFVTQDIRTLFLSHLSFFEMQSFICAFSLLLNILQIFH